MKIENLGPIDKLEIELQDGLFFVGENSTGKTYLSFLLFGLYNFVDTIEFEFLEIDDIKKFINKEETKFELNRSEGRISKAIAKSINEHIDEILLETFNSEPMDFSDTKIEVNDKDAEFLLPQLNFKERRLKTFSSFKFTSQGFDVQPLTTRIEIENEFIELFLEDSENIQGFSEDKPTTEGNIEQIWDDNIRRFHSQLNRFLNRIYKFDTNYFPSERIGINTFFDELQYSRTNSSRSSKSSYELSDNVVVTKTVERKFTPLYPTPISSYINLVNDKVFSARRGYDPNVLESASTSNYEKAIQNYYKEILKGRFEYNSELEKYNFIPNEINNNSEFEVPFMVSSSSSKSLFALDSIFLGPSRKKVIFIDEPEMNLDARTQRSMVDFLLDLVLLDVRIVITTHSDIFVRELANKLNDLNGEYTNIRNRISMYSLGQYNNKTARKLDLSEFYRMSHVESVLEELDDEYMRIEGEINEKEEEGN